MADLSDVTQALVALVAAAVYPNGTAAPSVTGAPTRIYEGWPVPRQLDEELQAGAINVSVYPLPGEQLTTRYLNDGEDVLSISTPKLSASLTGQVITLSGQIPAADDPHTLLAIVNGQPYEYAIKATDTMAQAAAGLAARIATGVPGTTSAGAAITVPAAGRIRAVRVAVTGSFVREVRRQARNFQITIWAPSPELRAQAAGAIDPVLADTEFLTLPDQKARLRYVASPISDGGQQDRAWRRDLIYMVDYGTTVQRSTTTVASMAISTTPEGVNPAVANLNVNTTNL